MKKYLLRIRCAAIILITAGYAWADGHYIPANSSILAYLFQFIIIIALLITGIKSLSIPGNEKNKNKWAVTGFSIFSVLALLVNILNIVHDAYNSDVNFYNSHNTIAGLLPVVLLITGNVLWIITILEGLKEGTKAKYLFKSQYNIL